MSASGRLLTFASPVVIIYMINRKVYKSIEYIGKIEPTKNKKNVKRLLNRNTLHYLKNALGFTT